MSELITRRHLAATAPLFSLKHKLSRSGLQETNKSPCTAVYYFSTETKQHWMHDVLLKMSLLTNQNGFIHHKAPIKYFIKLSVPLRSTYATQSIML